MEFQNEASTAIIVSIEGIDMPAKDQAACDALYKSLDPALAKLARDAADRIRIRVADTRLDIGRELLTIKDSLGHGVFGQWLSGEFNMSERTAQNFMSVAILANERPEIVAALPVTAIYKLAAPSTPNSVMEEISEQIQRGDIPTSKEVVSQITEAKRRNARKKSKRSIASAAEPMEISAASDPTPGSIIGHLASDHGVAERLQAANDAVELLRTRLDKEFGRFVALIERTNHDEFLKALRDALAVLPATCTVTIPRPKYDRLKTPAHRKPILLSDFARSATSARTY